MIVDGDRLKVARVLCPPPRAFDPREHSRETALRTGSESRVQQHLKDEVDVNTIVRRFGLTGGAPAPSAAGVYGDFTGIEDYESALGVIERARERFEALPPEVRQRFHSPGELLEVVGELSQEEFEAEYMPPAPPVVPAPAAPVVPAAR